MATLEQAIAQAMSLSQAGEVERAIQILRRAVDRAPSSARAIMLLGLLLHQAGQKEQAIYQARRATQVAPRDAEAWVALGMMQLTGGDEHAGLESFSRGAELNPAHPRAWDGKSNCLQLLGRLKEAKACSRQAVSLAPNDPQARLRLARVLTEIGRADEAMEHFRVAARFAPDVAVLWADYAQATLYAESVAPQECQDAHAGAGRLLTLPRPLPAPDRSEQARRAHAALAGDRRVRVGYLSGDFRGHSVSYFIEPILRAHDRHRFEIFCYQTSNPKGDDATTRRLRELGHAWRAVSTLDDAALASVIREDQIDVLIELSGLTPGQRLRTLSLRPALVQASAIGYPHGLPASFVDFRIADAITDPPSVTPASTPTSPSVDSSSDRVRRIDPCFLCYLPPNAAQEARLARAALASQAITFASFNNITKLTPSTMDAWARIVRAVPGSRLLLKSHKLATQDACDDVVDRFVSLGLAREQLDVRASVKTTLEHLMLYNQVSIALDTFPYNGTTTTLEALAMGVPVITRRGDTHRSRVGASLLSAIEHPEWISDTADDYCQKAIALAHDAALLERLRRELPGQLAASPLGDAARYTRKLEAQYLDQIAALATGH
ncbi:MAG: tetratricopeptide repeat protein [Planctomycetota bacterium]|nr:tetratricopeptide repeat protein [Planctomycetota bacterium]